MEDKARKSVATGASILIAANLVVKVIGLVYKIPLANILGNEGMGYLSSAYEIYQLLLSLFMSGGTVAVSKLVAESMALGNRREVVKIVRVMFLTFATVGWLGWCLMFFGAPVFSSATSAGAVYCIRVLSPAIFFLSLSAVIRGYYQGQQNMRPTGLSQVIEAVCKLAIGIGAALLMRDMFGRQDLTAAAGISGTSISTFIGTVVLFAIFFSKKRREEYNSLAEGGGKVRRVKDILSGFWKIAIPLAASAMVVNLTGVLDLFLIFDRLKSMGLSKEAANAAYGGYKGYAQTLFNLPPSIISSINVTIIPAISAATVVGDNRRARHVAGRAVKLVLLLAVPCAIGLVVLADPIQRMLFPTRLDEIAATTPLLKILGVASFFTCLATLTTAILQASGNMRLPVFSLIVGGLVKLAANYILVGTPGIGILGAPIGTNLCYIAMFVINAAAIRKKTKIRLGLVNRLVKPLFAGALMGIFAYYSRYGLAMVIPGALATALSISLSAVLYGGILLLTGGITGDDVSLLPAGKKIELALRKLRLLKK